MGNLPIGEGFYESRFLPLSAQECINYYVGIPQATALSERILVGTPGIPLIATTGTTLQSNRGAWVKNGIPYFVNGDALYRLNKADGVYSVTELGTVEGTGRVSMADNGTQLMILVPDGKGYIYNEDAGTPFQEITDSDLFASGNPQVVKFVDGYFACTTDSKKWIVSDLGDGLSWNALFFGSAESDPDDIVAIAILSNQVFILGSVTSEGQENVGGAGFPFQRNNVFLDKGCAAPFAVVNSNKTFFMLGKGLNETPAVWQYDGNDYAKVSTDAMDAVIARYTEAEIGDVFAFAYAADGAFFVCFTFPDRTFTFNQTTGVWCEQKTYNDGIPTRWRVNSVVTAYGLTLVADAVDGRIGYLDFDHNYEYDDSIIRIWTTQPFASGGNDVIIPQLELTMEAGSGNDDVENPVVSLAISENGKTFNYERVRAIGKKGEYGRRIFWRKNGVFKPFVVFRFRLSDPVNPVIIKLEST